jgi:hypothetical protein
MTPNELYKLLDSLGIEWECRDVFEGMRVINIMVEEDDDEE